MERDEVFDFISKIRDKVIAKLDATKTPCYPKYYERLFREILAEKANPEITQLFQRYSETTDTENQNAELEKYIALSKKSLDAFSSSNKSMSKTVMAQGGYLESINLDAIDNAHVDYQKIINSLLGFQGQLTDELRRSDEQIRKLEAELERALNDSKIDPLTKLLNKRAFVSDMEQTLAAAKDRQLDMSLLFIDMDDFDIINANYGCLVSDKVLIFLANTFKNSIRDGDKVYRYGEDEFVIVLNRLLPEKSVEIANRIRSRIEMSKLIYVEQIIRVAVSIGVSHYKPGDNLNDLLARAIDALKEAKQSGKNIVKEKD